MSSNPIILVVKNRAMGDSLMGLGALAYLRSVYPKARIIYAIPSWMTPLYRPFKTDADKIISLDLSSLKEGLRTWKEINKEKIDWIIELNQRGRSAKFFKLFSLITRTPYFYHNHNTKKGNFIEGQGKTLPSIQRDLNGCWSVIRFLESKTWARPDYLNFSPNLKGPILNSPKNSRLIVFGIVASRKTKVWPLSYFKRLWEKILDHDSECKIIIPLSDSVLDRDLARELKELSPPPEVELLKTSLDQLPEKLARASLYIGNDTGIKHLMIAMGARSISFFAQEGPLEWHPYNKDLHHYFYIPELACRTRTHHYCGLEQCSDMVCLESITSGQVFSFIKEKKLLSSPR